MGGSSHTRRDWVHRFLLSLYQDLLFHAPPRQFLPYAFAWPLIAAHNER